MLSAGMTTDKETGISCVPSSTARGSAGTAAWVGAAGAHWGQTQSRRGTTKTNTPLVTLTIPCHALCIAMMHVTEERHLARYQGPTHLFMQHAVLCIKGKRKDNPLRRAHGFSRCLTRHRAQVFAAGRLWAKRTHGLFSVPPKVPNIEKRPSTGRFSVAHSAPLCEPWISDG